MVAKLEYAPCTPPSCRGIGIGIGIIVSPCAGCSCVVVVVGVVGASSSHRAPAAPVPRYVLIGLGKILTYD